MEVIEFFPDLSLFIESAKILMKQKGEIRLSNPVVYRLKRLYKKCVLRQCIMICHKNNGAIWTCFFVLFSSLIMSNFKISSLNVNGARDVNKRAQVYELMKLKNIDVMFCKRLTAQRKMKWNG